LYICIHIYAHVYIYIHICIYIYCFCLRGRVCVCAYAFKDLSDGANIRHIIFRSAFADNVSQLLALKISHQQAHKQEDHQIRETQRYTRAPATFTCIYAGVCTYIYIYVYISLSSLYTCIHVHVDPIYMYVYTCRTLYTNICYIYRSFDVCI